MLISSLKRKYLKRENDQTRLINPITAFIVRRQWAIFSKAEAKKDVSYSGISYSHNKLMSV